MATPDHSAAPAPVAEVDLDRAVLAPGHTEHLAQLSQPADLGCVRDQYLWHGVADVLVRRPGAGSGHATIFPPYFVAGAVFAGFAMVLLLIIPIRKALKLEDFITSRHLQNMAKLMLVTGLIVAYGYVMEFFFAWYSGNPYEIFAIAENRPFGPYRVQWMALIFCNFLAVQVLWFKKVRTSTVWLWVISAIISVGMWLERLVICVLSLSRDFLPSSWDYYSGTFWDWALYLGTIGFFLSLMFLFVRFVPMIAMSEMKMMLPEAEVGPGRHEES